MNPKQHPETNCGATAACCCDAQGGAQGGGDQGVNGGGCGDENPPSGSQSGTTAGGTGDDGGPDMGAGMDTHGGRRMGSGDPCAGGGQAAGGGSAGGGSASAPGFADPGCDIDNDTLNYVGTEVSCGTSPGDKSYFKEAACKPKSCPALTGCSATLFDTLTGDGCNADCAKAWKKFQGQYIFLEGSTNMNCDGAKKDEFERRKGDDIAAASLADDATMNNQKCTDNDGFDCAGTTQNVATKKEPMPTNGCAEVACTPTECCDDVPGDTTGNSPAGSTGNSPSGSQSGMPAGQSGMPAGQAGGQAGQGQGDQQGGNTGNSPSSAQSADQGGQAGQGGQNGQQAGQGGQGGQDDHDVTAMGNQGQQENTNTQSQSPSPAEQGENSNTNNPPTTTGSTNTEDNTNTQSQSPSSAEQGANTNIPTTTTGSTNTEDNTNTPTTTTDGTTSSVGTTTSADTTTSGTTNLAPSPAAKDTAGWPSPTCEAGSDPCGTASGDKKLYTGATCETCTAVQDTCSDDTMKAYYDDGCFAACAKKFTKAGLEATFKSLGCTDDQKAAYTTVLKENGVDVDSTGKPVYDTNTKKTRTTQLRINDGNSTTLDDKEEDDSDMLSDELNAGKRVELAAMVLLVVMTGVAAVTY